MKLVIEYSEIVKAVEMMLADSGIKCDVKTLKPVYQTEGEYEDTITVGFNFVVNIEKGVCPPKNETMIRM